MPHMSWEPVTILQSGVYFLSLLPLLPYIQAGVNAIGIDTRLVRKQQVSRGTVGYSNWLSVFTSFRILAAVILSSAFLTSVAFTATPEYHAAGAAHYSAQSGTESTASRFPQGR